MREAKRAKEKRDRNAAVSAGKQAGTFFGAMEGLDEKEQREQIELTRLVVDDLSALAEMFVGDQLMAAAQFKAMMAECGNLRVIGDYEAMSDKATVRAAVLNEVIRGLEMDFAAHAKDFWRAMQLLTVNRDRLLLRVLIEQSEEMRKKGTEGVLLGVVNTVHIHGIETMWKSNKFWSDEQDARENVKEMADRNRIKEELEEGNAPFFGKNDPARESDVNDATKF